MTNPLKPGTLTFRAYAALLRAGGRSGGVSLRAVERNLVDATTREGALACLETLAEARAVRAYQDASGFTYWTAIPEDIQRATAVSDDQATATIGATCPVEFARCDENTVELESTGERCYVYESARGVVAWFTVGTRALVRIDSMNSRRA